MQSDLKRISRDLLIYSALVSDFEPLDFKNDALAGVRANFFNAHHLPQAEKTELSFDGKPLNLSYSLKDGEPLSWKAIYNNQPYQTVKREGDNIYCVLSYDPNGVVTKRQFFDYSHTWLRTEYYGADSANALRAVLSPQLYDGVVILKYKAYRENGSIRKRYLFPSTTQPKSKCRSLVYANFGMIWYDERFRPEDYVQEAENAKKGFRFDIKAFTPNIYTTVTDVLDNAPYLTEADVQCMKPQGAPAPEIEDDGSKSSYSAYDKIESILFEAHKTNKNIFGEIANHTDQTEAFPKEEPEPNSEPGEEQPGQPEQQPEPTKVRHAVAKEPPESVDEAAQEMAEAFGVSSAAMPHEEHASFEPAREREPDAVTQTPSGTYRYYGELDSENRRTGRGRTVSDKGITSYEGDYEAGKRHGFGICYYKEGSVNYVGNWENGSRSGAGVGYRLSDGTMHAGGWSNNAPQGFGARFDKDGNFVDVCTYVDGKRNGRSLSFDEDGNVVVRLWSNGELLNEKIIGD